MIPKWLLILAMYKIECQSYRKHYIKPKTLQGCFMTIYMWSRVVTHEINYPKEPEFCNFSYTLTDPPKKYRNILDSCIFVLQATKNQI